MSNPLSFCLFVFPNLPLHMYLHTLVPPASLSTWHSYTSHIHFCPAPHLSLFPFILLSPSFNPPFPPPFSPFYAFYPSVLFCWCFFFQTAHCRSSSFCSSLVLLISLPTFLLRIYIGPTPCYSLPLVALSCCLSLIWKSLPYQNLRRKDSLTT